MLWQQVFYFAALLALGCTAARPHEHHHDKHHDKHEKRQGWGGQSQYQPGIFDYIVVGSGPGGSPLACRLARAGFLVLLIEAGEDVTPYQDVQVPSYHPRASELPQQMWSYYVQRYADPNLQFRDGKQVYEIPDAPDLPLYTTNTGHPPPNGDWTFQVTPGKRYYTGTNPPPGAQHLGLYYPRGSALGGCSQMNAMAMVYPFMDDWDHIAQITGNQSWNAEIMRSYLIKLERVEYALNSVLGHGFKGWFHLGITPLSLVAQDARLISLVVATATAIGRGTLGGLGGLLTTVTGLMHIMASDINAPGRSRDMEQNIWQIPISINPTSSLRASSVDFVHQTVQEGYPLIVQLNTFATKILIDRSGFRPRAVGVEYLNGPHLYSASPLFTGAQGVPGYVYARREVIIACGAFETPKLLKLSGIGPAQELAQFGIPTVVNLPGVGNNLQDRYEVGVVGRAETPFSVFGACTYNYRDQGQGDDPCLAQFKNGVTPMLKGPYVSNGLALGTTIYTSVNDGPTPDLFIVAVPAYFGGYYPGYSKAAVLDALHWTFVILKVRSRNSNAGTVTLRSTNPLDMPNINFNYFTYGAEQDVQSVVEGIERARGIFDSVIPLDGGFTEEVPGRQYQGAALSQWVRDYAWGHHAGCTAKIGAYNDPYAVVDFDFRVFGVDGLRVVDHSVFPSIPGYYPTLAIYMISEKAADVILGQSPAPVSDFDNLDLGGGPVGTLASALVGGITGVMDPNKGLPGILGSFGSLLGGTGLGLFDGDSGTAQKRWLEDMGLHPQGEL